MQKRTVLKLYNWWRYTVVLLTLFSAATVNAAAPRILLRDVVAIPSGTNGMTRIAFTLRPDADGRNVAQFKLQTVTLNGVNAQTTRLPLYQGKLDANGEIPLAFDFPTSNIGTSANGTLNVTGSYSYEAVPRTIALTHAVTLPTATNLGTIIARFYLPETTAPNGRRLLGASEDATIRLNGISVGVSNAGISTLSLAPARYQLDAVLPSQARVLLQEQAIDVVAGQTTTLDILLNDEGETTEQTTLESPECPDGILSADFSSFQLKFALNGAVAKLESFSEVTLRAPGNFSDLTDLFQLDADGTIRASNLAVLRNALTAQAGKLQLHVSAQDLDGFSHADTLSFSLGSYTIKGRLQPPPSAPTLPVAGLTISLWTLEEHLGLVTTSQADGSFEFATKVPRLPILIRAETMQGGKYYYATATLLMSGDRDIALPLLGAIDQLNGVPSYHLLNETLPRRADTIMHLPRAAQQAALQRITPRNVEGVSQSTFAMASFEDIAQVGTATLTIPQGTSRLSLRYIIGSGNYPFCPGCDPTYRIERSPFNDLWSVSLLIGASGKQLFATSNAVKAQLRVNPGWQPDGSTVELHEDFDVSTLTASRAITAYLVVSITSSDGPSDPLNPDREFSDVSSAATISGEISTSPPQALEIRGIRRQSLEEDNIKTLPINDSSYYSMPRPGSTNTFHRKFVLDIKKPESVTLTRLKTFLESQPGAN
ncbi:hypothetical protein [Bryobacter aggregatus]|uniref:hypothetical protein n=1 Tax=Bryobacter aggregatus TaxID=360054 RepID=UPI0004E1F064|nr:hypothetical protein [Bryobacter aggregatus]